MADSSAGSAAWAPIAARPPPPAPGRLATWRAQLFGSAGATATTLALLALAAWALPPAVDWLLLKAVWSADAAACQAARGSGACWGVVAEKGLLIVFGRYPAEEIWRAGVAAALLLALWVASALPACWKPWLAGLWAAALAGFVLLMRGGLLGLAPVDTDRWGGLPLTLLLTTASLALAFPLAVAVALGRRSELPALRALCSVYVEAVRGVPLISVLFMASFMAPLLLPAGLQVDVLLRVIAALTLFGAAYLAEIVRGGLQAVPRAQAEAASALGLTRWQVQRSVVLPQALRHVVPAIVNHVIGVFKDTSLVTVVSLYELTGALSLALGGDTDWRPFKAEAYLFVAGIYFAACHAMSRYSRWLEARLRTR